MAKSKKFDINKIQDKVFSAKGIIIGGAIIAVLFIGSMVQQSFAPKQSNILYSICSNFVELHVTFPQNIRETDLDLYDKAVRIYYTQTDSFGQQRMEAVECSFYRDPQKGVLVDTILFDSVKDITESKSKDGSGGFYPVKRDVIDHFNQSGSPSAILSINNDAGMSSSVRVRRY